MKKFNLIRGKIEDEPCSSLPFARLRLARVGEEIAKEYLKNKGYKILEQNARSRFSEIDLIVKKNNQLILVEVRTKKGENFGSPEESLNKKKLKKLWFNAQLYIAKNHWQGAFRIDAVCVVLRLDNSIERVNHYENIIS